MSLSSSQAWQLLIHAHDALWIRREIPLRERIAACQILWEAAIRDTPVPNVSSKGFGRLLRIVIYGERAGKPRIVYDAKRKKPKTKGD